jgi:hypothetical protein
MTQQGLMQLTGLKQLQHFRLYHTQHLTHDVVEQLWVALRQKTSFD